MAGGRGPADRYTGCRVVTSGPGTTNLATGLITATTEQDPMIAICGAVARADRLKRTHQSMDRRRPTQRGHQVHRRGERSRQRARSHRQRDTHRGHPSTRCDRGGAAFRCRSWPLPRPPLTAIPAMPPLGPAPARRHHPGRCGDSRCRGMPVLFVGDRGGRSRCTAALQRAPCTVTDLPVVETFQAAGVVSRDTRGSLHRAGRALPQSTRRYPARARRRRRHRGLRPRGIRPATVEHRTRPGQSFTSMHRPRRSTTIISRSWNCAAISRRP